MIVPVTAAEFLLRPDIAALPAYPPNAKLDKSRPITGAEAPHWDSQRHSHLPKSGPIKLSSNENPYLPLPAVLTAVAQAAQEVNRYPDRMAADLVGALASKYGVEESQIAVGNGSVAVLSHILAAVLNPGDEVVYGWRSFEAYPSCVAVAHGVSVQVPITPEGRFDLPAMRRAITDKTKVVIVCSPNNPTGPAVSAVEFINFMNNLPERILVILHEDYTEFVRDPAAVDGMKLIEHYPNLVVIRTMSKAHGLAGLRVGFAIGDSALIAGVRAVSTPFGVNSLAQAAAVAALQPAAERVASARVATLIAERTRVVDGLRRQGWQVPDAQGNFVWLPLGHDAKKFADAALAEGMQVRHFDDDGINGGVRVTISEGAANNNFLTFAGRMAKEHISQ